MTSALWPPVRYRYDEVPEVKGQSQFPTPPDSVHPLGTDFMGRDLLSRMLWGSRISLSIGFVSTAISITLGVLLGALAGYYRGFVDIALSRVIEIMICFPSFFIILAVVAFLPPSIFYVMLVLGLFGWMGVARLQRGEFFRLMGQDFVVAARALGATNPRTMFRHVLPNGLAPVLVSASFGIASAMLTESGLSFLGFGVQEPATSWGQILYTGRTQLQHWWTFVIPGAAIFVAVTCYNLVGDGIRDAVDPRLKT
jgi:peptide/nickel transport system permease protein